MSLVIGINASPRKGKNSDAILKSALGGAKENGAEVKYYSLFDLNAGGCRSCFACKKLGGDSFGRCALKDDYSIILSEILEADVVFFSLPIYFGDVPGALRNLWERLWFPGLLYSKDGKIAYTKKVKVGIIYTMNVADGTYYNDMYANHRETFERLIGPTEYMVVTDTLQFDNYQKYASSMFNEAHKKKIHEEEFPRQLILARDFGYHLLKNKS